MNILLNTEKRKRVSSELNKNNERWPILKWYYLNYNFNKVEYTFVANTSEIEVECEISDSILTQESMLLAESSLREIWDDESDEVWESYLND